jgi:hypothetical protein
MTPSTALPPRTFCATRWNSTTEKWRKSAVPPSSTVVPPNIPPFPPTYIEVVERWTGRIQWIGGRQKRASSPPVAATYHWPKARCCQESTPLTGPFSPTPASLPPASPRPDRPPDGRFRKAAVPRARVDTHRVKCRLHAAGHQQAFAEQRAGRVARQPAAVARLVERKGWRYPRAPGPPARAFLWRPEIAIVSADTSAASE